LFKGLRVKNFHTLDLDEVSLSGAKVSCCQEWILLVMT